MAPGRVCQRGPVGHVTPAGNRYPVRGRELLLPDPVLRDREQGGARTDRYPWLQQAHRCELDVLELVGDDVDGTREGGERLAVAELRHRHAIGDLGGRAVGLGSVDMAPESEPGRGQGGHAAELPRRPGMPITLPGPSAAVSTGLPGTLAHRLRLRAPPRVEPGCEVPVAGCKNGGCQQGRVRRPGAADRERADRDAAGHLHDRQQAVETTQRPALDRDAEHRQRGLGRDHSRQVSRSPGTRDDDLEPAAAGFAGVGRHPVRRAVRGHQPHLVVDCKFLENGRGVAHGRPVRLASHDQSDTGPRGRLLSHGVLRCVSRLPDLPLRQ